MRDSRTGDGLCVVTRWDSGGTLFVCTRARVLPLFTAISVRFMKHWENRNLPPIITTYYNKAVEVNPSFEDGVKNRDLHRKKTGLDVHVPPGPE